MKLLLNFSSTFSLLFLFVATAFGHETEIPHEEPVPTISPLLLVGLVAILAIGGFLLWKFVLHTPKSSPPTQSDTTEKTTPAQEKNVSQSGESEVSSQSK